MFWGYDVGQGSETAFRFPTKDVNVEFGVVTWIAFFDSQNVSHGFVDDHEDACDVVAWGRFDVAGSGVVRGGEVVRSKPVIAEMRTLCHLDYSRIDAMCVQIIVEVIEVDVAAVGEIEHDTVSIAQPTPWRKKRLRYGYLRRSSVRRNNDVRHYPVY